MSKFFFKEHTMSFEQVSFQSELGVQNDKRICNAYVFRCTNLSQKVEILKQCVGYIIQYPFDFPDGPLDQQLQRFLEVLRFNTLDRYNTLLYFTILEDYHQVALLIEKHTGEIYLTPLRVDNELYQGTLFDGTLIDDRYIYPPTINHDINRGQDCVCKDDLDYSVEDFHHSEDAPISASIGDSSEETSSVSVVCEPCEPCDSDKVRPLIRVGRSIVAEFSKIKEQTCTSRRVFHVGDIYASRGELIDRTNTCYKKMELLNQIIKNPKIWHDDPVMHMFAITNHVVGSYYYPKTRQQIDNSFYNDYTRYHGKLVHIMRRNKLLYKQYSNPKKRALFEIRKTELPFIYELWLNNRRNPYGIALVPTSECEAYLVQLFRKMKPPIIVGCIYNGQTEKWTPVEHAYGNTKRTNDIVYVKKLEKL